MSRHSKWAKIKHQKGVEDIRRGAIFTKLARSITVAAREGGDPGTNFKLRLAIDQARSLNMPKENIERAIKRGTGELADESKIETVLYEGFFPGGVSLLIEALTDNKNRTASSVKHLLNKYNGGLGGPNSALWMFEKKGIIRCKKQENQNKENFELLLIEAGAQDLLEEDAGWTVYTNPEELQKIKENLEKQNILIEFAGIEWVAKNKIEMKEKEIKEKLEGLCDELDNESDINNYFTNAIGF